jgi:Domain of unknown function (DUF4174)
MTRRALATMLTIASALVSSACAPTPGISPADMRPHFWKERVVIVFAPSDADPRLAEQRAALAADPGGMAERKVISYEVVGTREVSKEGRPLGAEAAADFRERFNAPVEEFEVIVIGLDGLVKQRDVEVVDSGELFELIDSMPVRQAEMKSPPATRR